MRGRMALGILSLAVSPAIAQPQAAAPAPNAGPVLPPAAPRARGPALDTSVEMARTAIATCLTNGYKVTALVVDSAGVPVAMLSGDGAMQRTHVIAPTKIAMVMQYKEPSGVTTARAKTDPRACRRADSQSEGRHAAAGCAPDPRGRRDDWCDRGLGRARRRQGRGLRAGGARQG